MADMDQKDRCSCMYKAGIAGYYAPRAVFPSLVGRPRMLGILAGTDLKDSCSGMYKAGFSGVSAPRAVLPSLVGRPPMLGILAGADPKDSCSVMYKAGFSGVSAPRAVLPEALGAWRRVSRSSGWEGRVTEAWCGTSTRSLVALRMLSFRCLLGDGLRGEGLGIPSPPSWVCFLFPYSAHCLVRPWIQILRHFTENFAFCT